MANYVVQFYRQDQDKWTPVTTFEEDERLGIHVFEYDQTEQLTSDQAEGRKRELAGKNPDVSFRVARQDDELTND